MENKEILIILDWFLLLVLIILGIFEIFIGNYLLAMWPALTGMWVFRSIKANELIQDLFGFIDKQQKLLKDMSEKSKSGIKT